MADVEHRNEVSTEDSPEHRSSSPLFLDFDPLSFTFTDNGGVGSSGSLLDDLPHANPTELTLSPTAQELTSLPSKDSPSPPASLPTNLTFSQPDIVTSSQQELTPSPLDVLNGYPQNQLDVLDHEAANEDLIEQEPPPMEDYDTFQSILNPNVSLFDELDLVPNNAFQTEDAYSVDTQQALEETHSPGDPDELDLVPNNAFQTEDAYSADIQQALEETHSPGDPDSPQVLEELYIIDKKDVPTSLQVEPLGMRREELVLSPLEPNYIQISEDDDILSPQYEIEVSPKEELTLSPLETVTPLPSDEYVLTPLKKSPEEPGKITPPGDLNLGQVGELNFFDPLSTIYESPVHERFNPNKTINNDSSPTDVPKTVEDFFDPFAPICESSDDSPSQVIYPEPADSTPDSGTVQSMPKETVLPAPSMEEEIIITIECVDDNSESLTLDPFFEPVNSNESSTPELEEAALELTEEDVEKKKSSSSKKKTVEVKNETKIVSNNKTTVTNNSSSSSVTSSKKEEKRHVSSTSIQLEKTPAKIHNIVTNGKDKEKSAFLEQAPEAVNGHKVEAPILAEIKPFVDHAKVVRKFSQNEKDAGTSQCKLCGKHVYQMEKLKAEKAIFHKQCFRCKECNKLLNVESYSAHEGTIYCKQHFRSLFQPKVKLDAEDSAPKRQRKHEMIIRENTPMELPPDVVRCESKPDYGLESLPSLSNVKSRFETTNGNHPLSPSKSELPIHRSESIMMRLARYQSAVRGELKAEEASSESDEDDEGETHIIRGDKTTKDQVPFTGMSNLKNQWEKGEVKSQKEEIIEMKREELKRLRQRMCLGRSESMKQVYEKACNDSKVVTPTREHMLPPHLPHADKIKERFEKGEVANGEAVQEKIEKLKSEKEDDLSVFSETGIGHNARSLFQQMDANVRITSPLMSPCKSPSRDIKKSYTQPFVQTEKANEDVVKCSEPTAKEDIKVETVEVSQKFKFFENYSDEPKERKRFQMTPPREPAKKEESPEPEMARNPDVVRCTNGHDEVPITDTARKMLDKFKAMEDSVDRPIVPTGLKPLKRITPPREYTGSNDHDSSPEPERDPSIIKSSYKSEDDYKGEADMAKTLREKFEKWQVDIVNSNHHNEEDELLPQIDTAKNLRAKFEAIKEESYRIKEKPLPRVKRFIQEPMQSPSEDCSACGKKVYPMEKLETSGLKFHKSCFRCCQCHCMLRLENYTTSGGQVFCSQDFKQLFISKGVCGDQLVSPSNGHI